MKLKLANKYFLIVFIIGFLSCKNNDEKPTGLPPISSEGKGTFGCRINGEMFMPTGFKGDLDKEYYTWKISPNFYGTFVLTAWRSGENGNLEVCKFSHPKIIKTGTFYLKYINDDTSGLGNCIIGNKHYSMLNSNKGNGKINIHRYDTVARIISGTFDFWTCNDKNKDDTAFVTDGRFDVKY